jgi:uroporphyrinogen-III synthase
MPAHRHGQPPVDSVPPHEPNALAGLTVVLPRSADRSAGMVAEFRRRGARPLLMPLIDFEAPADVSELDQALGLLAEGRFAWLIITSITTVRALKERAQAKGGTLADMVPELTKVAAVGETSRQALEAEGVPVDLVPDSEQSARGLVEGWPVPEDNPVGMPTSTAVLLPQSDLAADTIFKGLMDKGWQVLPVVAYRTVDYPAAQDRRLTVPPAPADTVGQAGAADGAGGAAADTLTPAQFASLAASGGVDAVVLTSPSVARRLMREAGPVPPQVLLVAIGRTTEAEAGSLGLRITATAAEPGPEGVADAVAAAAVERARRENND